MFYSKPKRKITKAMRIRKLKSKIARAEKKAAQEAELKRLQTKWDKMR